jgi:anti-sigma regulatory factor (Ser/Thr protein kinase)
MPAEAGGNALTSPAEPALLAAPVAGALAVLPPDTRGHLDSAGLSAGGCFVRPLPADTTCAGAARRYFREAVSSLAMPSSLLHDGVTMASELAANTLHAQSTAARRAGQASTVGGTPEIWVYLRGSGRTCELVCKVFDTERSWNAGPEPGLSKAPVDAIGGRGLQVVAGLSAGQWGCHPSRSRLGSWKVPGKVVWFALRIPPTALPEQFRRPRFGADWLVDELELMLDSRGLANSLVRADAASMSVLSLSARMTVWRHGDTVSWRSPAGHYQQMELADLIETVEQIVTAHEEIEFGGSPFPG